MTLKNGLARLALAAAACAVTAGPLQAASNKQLVIGISQEFENPNPLIATMSASRSIFDMTTRQLAAINTKWEWDCWYCVKLPTIKNGLAKMTGEGDKKVLTAEWEIKDGVNWGDGKPVTGEDFRLAWEIGRSPHVAVGAKELFEMIEELTVDSSNPRKFTIKYREPRFDFNQLGSFYPLPKHLEGPIWDKAKNSPGTYEKQTNYSVNPTNPGLYFGPYLVKEIKLSSHVVLERNPNFSGKKPAIEKIIFKLIPNTQTMEANLVSGSIDMIDTVGLSFDQAVQMDKRLGAKSKHQVLFKEGLIYEHIDLNLRNPMLQDVRVRKALVHAIDRDKLTQALFEGKQRKAISNVNPNDPYYTEDVVLYPYDTKKAGELLDAAGWALGKDGFRSKDGQRLSLLLMTTADNKTRELVQVWLQSEWKKVGVEVKIKNEPARVFFGETTRKAKYPAMAMYAWTSSPDSPPRSTLHSAEIPSEKNSFSGQNSGGYANKEVDTMLDQIRLEFDLAKRKAIMQKILWHYTNDVPVIPLYYRVEIAVVPKGLQGFVLTGHQYSQALNVEDWTFGGTAGH